MRGAGLCLKSAMCCSVRTLPSLQSAFLNASPMQQQTHNQIPARPPAGTYVKELDEDVRIREALSAVQLALLDTKERCAAFHQQFLKYSHLWQVDMQQALRTFLRSTTTAASGSSSAHGVPPTSTTGDAGAVVQQQQQQHAMGPRLEDFAAEIGKYKSIQDEVQALPSSAALGWVKVDAKPLKQAVLTWTSKWTYLYMRHLQDEVCTGCRQ